MRILGAERGHVAPSGLMSVGMGTSVAVFSFEFDGIVIVDFLIHVAYLDTFFF
jgi:hypothetical protein